MNPIQYELSNRPRHGSWMVHAWAKGNALSLLTDSTFMQGKQFDDPETDVRHARRKPWACLLKHVFAVDVNVCPKCAGRMKWRQVAFTADAIREGLARAGLAACGPPKQRRVPHEKLSLPFPKMRRV